MDPLTLALIVAGLFAAVRIKRASTPLPPQAQEAPKPGPISFGGFPPHAFGGRSLRPPVTHRGVSEERQIEGEVERGRGRERAEDEAADVRPLALGAGFGPRAQEAIASGPPADVVGVRTPYVGTTTQINRPSGTPRELGMFGPISGAFSKTTRMRG